IGHLRRLLVNASRFSACSAYSGRWRVRPPPPVFWESGDAPGAPAGAARGTPGPPPRPNPERGGGDRPGNRVARRGTRGASAPSRNATTVSSAPIAAPATPQGRPTRHPAVCVPPTWAPHL